MPFAVVIHGSDPDLALLHHDSPCEAGQSSGELEGALVFDSPKVVIGRGEGCDVRIPHRSVSQRHVSLRARGAEFVLVDEGSTNGTRHLGLKLPPAVPKRLGKRELFRLGAIWIEIVETTAAPTRNVRDRSKEQALALVQTELSEAGEDARPLLVVEEGPDAGLSMPVEQTLILGRSQEAEFILADPDISRRHVEITVRGDNLVVKDLGSKSGTFLDDRPLTGTETVWRAGQKLSLGSSVLSFSYPAAEALRERERAPDEKLAASELDYRVPATPAPQAPVALVEAENEVVEEGFDAPVEPVRPRYRGATWSITDFAVALLALGVFSLSAVGYLVLLR